jgi:NADH:ubiquinone oxidoreductase subunit E
MHLKATRPKSLLDLEEALGVKEVRILEKIVRKHKDNRGALMPVLQDINARYNYLPEHALRFVSRELHIPLPQVLHVSTFYNVFSLEPRGKYIIRVCVGTSCHVRGSGRILDKLQKQLNIGPGESTPDLRFTLETVRCLGCCALSPCIVVDKKTHARLRPDAISALLKTYE